jgi:FlaA1/EpsC-like NDP-sugar epimerase
LKTHVAPPARTRATASIALCFLYDMAVGVGAMSFAVTELGAGRGQIEGSALVPGVLFAVFLGLAMWLSGLHRAVWRYVGYLDIMRLARVTGLTLIVFSAVKFFAPGTLFPGILRGDGPSVLVGGVLAFALMAAGRLAVRGVTTGDVSAAFRPQKASVSPAVVFGAHEDVAAALRDARRANGGAQFRPVAIVETDPSNQGRTIEGVPVAGDTSTLEHTMRQAEAREGKKPTLAVAARPGDREVWERALAVAAYLDAPVRRIASGDRTATLEPVAPQDLLARAPRKLDPARVRAFLEGRVVMITGAGGTIGSELSRQIAAGAPALVVLVDASERALYEVHLDLREGHPDLAVEPVIADVRNVDAVRDVFERFRPDVVLHAAALKHVPLMEQNPIEAVRVNVGGVQVVAEAAARSGVGAFVFISTDKAVNPTNVMGATKRVGELIVQDWARRAPAVRWSCVRFGNVLGSSGSVVPLFERQINRGGPVTVTDPEITRYFMTVEEASSLVLQAAALEADGGPLYVLDMGEPVKIADLARQMIRLKGFEPDVDIAIRFTGLRPGEKLHEEVFHASEDVKPSLVDGVLIATEQPLQSKPLQTKIEALVAAATARDADATLRALSKLVPAFVAPPRKTVPRFVASDAAE